MSKEPFRSLQKEGKKLFINQSDDELLLDVIANNWTKFLFEYGITGFAWLGVLLTMIIGFAVTDPISALTVVLTMLLIAMAIDSAFMLKITNRNLDTLLITSKRLLAQKYRGLVSHSTDHISFDNVNECVHSVTGVFRGKIAQEGKLTLRMSSGEDRVFHYIPRAWEVADMISHARELHVGIGKPVSFAELFSKRQETPQQNESFMDAITQLQDTYSTSTLSSLPPQ